jgi:hypothetical protein
VAELEARAEGQARERARQATAVLGLESQLKAAEAERGAMERRYRFEAECLRVERSQSFLRVEQLGRQRQQVEALEAELKQAAQKHASAWAKVSDKGKQMVRMKRELTSKITHLETRMQAAEQVGGPPLLTCAMRSQCRTNALLWGSLCVALTHSSGLLGSCLWYRPPSAHMRHAEPMPYKRVALGLTVRCVDPLIRAVGKLFVVPAPLCSHAPCGASAVHTRCSGAHCALR